MIPKQFIQVILEKADIAEIISGYMELSPIGEQFRETCPFCNSSKATFNVSTIKRIYKCFKCGRNGDVINLFRKLIKYPSHKPSGHCPKV